MLDRASPTLTDSHERKFTYLRLSVTDRCDFRCVYCLPHGWRAGRAAGVGAGAPELSPELSSELSVPEIRRLVAAFVQMGVTKVRLTGGEPTVRRDIVEIARAVAEVDGVRKVAITTNGKRLAELAGPLRAAGVTAVNVSVDSLDRETFRAVTGSERMDRVLAGVDTALSSGFESVKVNAVLLRDVNDGELPAFLDWAREHPVGVRFIELMRTGKNRELFEARHLSAATLRSRLVAAGWALAPREADAGPAEVYRRAGYAGSVGLIAPYARGFCESCNRLRVSSRGALRLCLFGDGDASLRGYLGDDSMRDALVERVRELVAGKPAAHFLKEGKYGNTWNLAAIGG